MRLCRDCHYCSHLGRGKFVCTAKAKNTNSLSPVTGEPDWSKGGPYLIDCLSARCGDEDEVGFCGPLGLAWKEGSTWKKCINLVWVLIHGRF